MVHYINGSLINRVISIAYRCKVVIGRLLKKLFTSQQPNIVTIKPMTVIWDSKGDWKWKIDDDDDWTWKIYDDIYDDESTDDDLTYDDESTDEKKEEEWDTDSDDWYDID